MCGCADRTGPCKEEARALAVTRPGSVGPGRRAAPGGACLVQASIPCKPLMSMKSQGGRAETLGALTHGAGLLRPLVRPDPPRPGARWALFCHCPACHPWAGPSPSPRPAHRQMAATDPSRVPLVCWGSQRNSVGGGSEIGDGGGPWEQCGLLPPSLLPIPRTVVRGPARAESRLPRGLPLGAGVPPEIWGWEGRGLGHQARKEEGEAVPARGRHADRRS